MNRATTYALSLLVLLTGAVTSAAAKTRVVTSHADLAALTMAVGGDRVEVLNLAEPTQDPHFVDAKPSLMLALNAADLVVIVGLELEVGWLPTLLTGSRNPKILPGQDGYLDTSAYVERRRVPTGPVDRSMGDLHAGGNPHFSRDPRSGLRIASAIARRLSRLDPEGASTYRAHYAAFEEALEKAMGRWAERLAAFRGREIVGYHESWAYFAEWAGLRIELFVEPKPGIPPDPAHVAHVLGLMRARQIPAILQEEYYPDATSGLLAKKSGAALLLMPGGAHIGSGETYIAYVERQVSMVVEALSPAKEGTP